MQVTWVKRPDVNRSNSFYCTNHPPLVPSPLVKLPLGSVRPRGWLMHQLDLMTEGMAGRLPEVSHFLQPDNGWLGGDGDAWEEQPYWFRGFYRLAVLTGNEEHLDIASHWLERILSTQDPDGYFGPRCLKQVPVKHGPPIPDIWPHMLMMDALEAAYEHTNDQRIIDLMQGFFRYCRDMPDDQFLPFPFRTMEERNLLIEHFFYGDFRRHLQNRRCGEMIPHVHWLYNQTGDAMLLDLAARFHHMILPPMSEWLDVHVINFIQRHTYPAYFYPQSGDPSLLKETEYWYRQHLNVWGQQPRGIFGADEVVRSGKVDPRQAFETCGFVEFIISSVGKAG